MFMSHVKGTFGSNRLYTVGRVVKVEDLMRWRFAPRGFDSLRISMQNSSINFVSPKRQFPILSLNRPEHTATHCNTLAIPTFLKTRMRHNAFERTWMTQLNPIIQVLLHPYIESTHSFGLMYSWVDCDHLCYSMQWVAFDYFINSRLIIMLHVLSHDVSLVLINSYLGAGNFAFAYTYYIHIYTYQKTMTETGTASSWI